MQPSLRQPQLDIEPLGKTLVIRFSHRDLVDEAMIEALGARLVRAIEQLRPARLVLNLSSVHWMGSAMVSRLITFQRRLKASGGELVLCGIQPDLLNKIFRNLKLHKVFRLCEDEKRALEAL
jgi:anti-anti-sigma factor